MRERNGDAIRPSHPVAPSPSCPQSLANRRTDTQAHRDASPESGCVIPGAVCACVCSIASVVSDSL